MEITVGQIVDAVRAMRYPRVFMDEAEADRLGKITNARNERYEKLKRTASFEEADMIASAEMLAEMLGISTNGIEEEIRGRFRRQAEAWRAEMKKRR